VDWAHGRANLCQPLQKPSHDNYFEQDEELQKMLIHAILLGLSWESL